MPTIAWVLILGTMILWAIGYIEYVKHFGVLVTTAEMRLDHFLDWWYRNPHIALKDSIVGQELLRRAIDAERRLRPWTFFGDRAVNSKKLSLLYIFIDREGSDDPEPTQGLPDGSPCFFNARNLAPFS